MATIAPSATTGVFSELWSALMLLLPFLFSFFVRIICSRYLLVFLLVFFSFVV